VHAWDKLACLLACLRARSQLLQLLSGWSHLVATAASRLAPCDSILFAPDAASTRPPRSGTLPISTSFRLDWIASGCAFVFCTRANSERAAQTCSSPISAAGEMYSCLYCCNAACSSSSRCWPPERDLNIVSQRAATEGRDASHRTKPQMHAKKERACVIACLRACVLACMDASGREVRVI
jgi:hypothetical protein